MEIAAAMHVLISLSSRKVLPNESARSPHAGSRLCMLNVDSAGEACRLTGTMAALPTTEANKTEAPQALPDARETLGNVRVQLLVCPFNADKFPYETAYSNNIQ